MNQRASVVRLNVLSTGSSFRHALLTRRSKQPPRCYGWLEVLALLRYLADLTYKGTHGDPYQRANTSVIGYTQQVAMFRLGVSPTGNTG